MGGYAAPLHPSIAGVASDSPLLCATRARPKPPSTNASTLVRPSWRRDSLANPKASSGPWPERWAGGARPIMVEGSPKQSLRCFLPVRWDYMYCNTVEALLTSNDLFSPGPVHPSYHHDVRRPPAPPAPVDSASTACDRRGTQLFPGSSDRCRCQIFEFILFSASFSRFL